LVLLDRIVKSCGGLRSGKSLDDLFAAIDSAAIVWGFNAARARVTAKKASLSQLGQIERAAEALLKALRTNNAGGQIRHGLPDHLLILLAALNVHEPGQPDTDLQAPLAAQGQSLSGFEGQLNALITWVQSLQDLTNRARSKGKLTIGFPQGLGSKSPDPARTEFVVRQLSSIFEEFFGKLRSSGTTRDGGPGVKFITAILQAFGDTSATPSAVRKMLQRRHTGDASP